MSNQRLSRERAKELLAELDSLSSKQQGPALRKAAVQMLNRIAGYSWVCIYLLRGNELRLDAWSGPAPTTYKTIPVGKGICGWVAKSGRTEIVSDVSNDPRFQRCFTSTMSEMAVPVTLDGKVVAEVDVESDLPSAHSSVDREFMEAVAAKIALHCV